MFEALRALKPHIKPLLIVIAVLIISNAILTPVLNLAAGPFAADGKGLRYTPAHFKSPSVPLGVGEFAGSMADDYNVAAPLFAVILMLVYLALAVAAAAGAGKWRECPSSVIKTMPRIGKRTRVIAGAFLLLFIMAAAAFKMVYTVPLSQKGSKVRMASGFFINFNKALFAKLDFDETAYRTAMFKALKLDRDDYYWFAQSGYWAYFKKEGRFLRTSRGKYAARELYIMFEEELLRPEDIFVGYKLSYKVGNMKRAGKMIEYLRNNNPENKDYERLFKGRNRAG